MKRKLVGIMAGVLVLTGLAGCGDSADSKEATYVKGLLDVAYNQGVEDYVEVTGTKEDDAKAYTQQSLEAETKVMAAYLGLADASGEAVDVLTNLCGKICEKASYEVEEKDDKVQVTIKPLDIFSEEVENYIDEYNMKEFIDGDPSCTDEEFVDGLAEILEKELKDPSYEKEVKVQVTVEKEGDSYVISDEDLEKIDSQVILY